MNRCLSGVLLIAMCLSSGGCYYEVRDARTGRMYYADKWIAADGYRGPLTFTDHTGKMVRVDQAEVLRLNWQDYLEATTPAAEGQRAEPR